MKINSFNDLFLVILSDIFFVENQIIAEFPKIINKAHSEELKEALKHHLNETKMQEKRLEKIFKILNENPIESEWVNSLMNVFARTDKFLEQNTSSSLLDAAIIALLQRIEHFEIATYGTLIEYAKVFDQEEVKTILAESLKEEGKADTTLTKLAEGGWFNKGINVEALRHI